VNHIHVEEVMGTFAFDSFLQHWKLIWYWSIAFIHIKSI
jgi:hypothetical protein